jgi:DNA-binding beta-propeller fold protein YncE
LFTYTGIFGGSYLAFDGTSMWATGLVSNKVFKLALNGSGMIGYNVRRPDGIAFDGADLWVANHESGTVTEIRASDGAIIGNFRAGGMPVGVAFDGANIWVACVGQVRKL